MEEPGLNRVIRAGYDLLGLQTYFTAGVKEVRAWTIPVGATAPKRQVRFTQISRKALFVPKLLATTTTLLATASREQKTLVNGVWRAKNIS